MDKSAICFYNNVMQNTGIFLHKEVTTLIDAFALCFSVKVTFFSVNMEELIVGLKNPGSQYCRHIQTELLLREKCILNDHKMCRYVAHSKSSTTYSCHAGLLESIIPIIIEDKIIGYLVVGQYRDSLKVPEDIVALWEEKFNSKKEIVAAYAALPYFTHEVQKNMLRLVTMLVQYIASRDYVSLRKGFLIERIKRYIDDNISKNISLSNIAKALDCSESTISHIVKKQLGISFSRLVNLRKIDRFEMLMRMDLGQTIRDTSYQVGYQDQFYFSRLYKKVRGYSPSKFLSTIKKVNT
jgi:AraC-like DNA-binding protein